jgi:membrane protein YdbS with pleckstrin-like domain
MTVSRPRYQDMIVPRVFVEPDEDMDRLRRRVWRWAIGRDVVLVAVGLLVIGHWVWPTVWSWLGG